MTMEQTGEFQGQIAFHLTGAPGGHLEPVDAPVRPALLAPYRDLAALRYDYPVVLVEDSTDDACVCSLTALVDDLLRDSAPRGTEGERVRRAVLRAEREIRRLLAAGARGTLSDLWARAAPHLAEEVDHLKVDGVLADCDHELPRRVIDHAWRSVQRQKAWRFHADVDRLVQALSDVLRAAFIHSEPGRRPESLEAAFGSLHRDQFDFEMMSRLLGRSAPRDELPPDRRERIQWVLEVLRRQRFFDPPHGAELAQSAAPPFEYRFSSCADAIEAFRERLPNVVEFVKAMSIAELEAEGRYVSSQHDAFFQSFDENSLSRDDLARFPDYLVSVHGDESGAVIDLLSSGLPVKVLVETEELLAPEHFGVHLRSTQLASTVIGLMDVFAFQATSSSLYQLRERLLAGLRYTGPTLLSVFSGTAAPSSDLPPYLLSAAALEGRAFPAFTYDPTAGPDLASRFSVDENPQPELDWPLAPLEYADASLQRVVEEVPFTLVDFAACDRRYARHFARISREHWSDETVPVDEWLALHPAEAETRVPHVLVVDETDRLERLIVDARLMHAARRCRELWHGLQELGLAHLRVEPAPVDEAVGESVAEEPEAEVVVQAAADDPWIETPRCSTCNECTGINDRMFAYNDNKQAYIKDPDAGSFRELVEAAESCQVAVIHPGRPRNPHEPGLEDLIERAKAFQ
ncbi:MAG TPA: hypothetical protein VEF89_12175 [Solirubrobacteraceae bacterium]|nr:hypothetical protein [Solirubrobacteraceae bacterium]